MEKPTLRQISCFLEVCRDFHFSRAAERLGMAQPPLSRHVKELERIVGVPLFRRSGKRTVLTNSGEAFLKTVYRLPDLLDRAVVAARRAAAGEAALLRIGFVGALLDEELLRIFERFRAENPDTQLVLEDMTPRRLLERVSSGELDGAFLGVRPPQLPASINCLAWREEPLRVCLPPRHPLGQRKQIRVEEIADEPLVALAADVAPAYRELVDDLYRANGHGPASVQETNAVAAVLALVVAGCGITFLPESAIQSIGVKRIAAPLLTPQVRLPEVFVASEDRIRQVERFRALLTE